MSKAGSRILEGAREALAVAKGEAPAASITVNGHRYVPADRIESLEREAEELREKLETERAIKRIMPHYFPYQQTFNAIAAAVTVEKGVTVGISVNAFAASFREATRIAGDLEDGSTPPRKPTEAEGREANDSP